MQHSIAFLYVDNPYNSTHLFIENLKKAFDMLGFVTRKLSMHEENAYESLQNLIKDPPRLIISFSYVAIKDDIRDVFLASLLNTWHLTYWLDSPFHVMSLFNDPLNVVSLVDFADSEGLRKMGKNTFFLPHAVEKNERFSIECKSFDFVMTASYLDFEERKASWISKFGKSTYKKLLLAIDLYKSKPLTPFIHILNEAFNGVFDWPFKDVFFEFEYYIKGLDRYECIIALDDFSVDLFGQSSFGSSWKEKLKHFEHVKIHPPLNYTKSLEVQRKAKVVINSSPQFPFGSHERVFNALSVGSIALTSPSVFFQNEFQNDAGIFYFSKENKELMHNDMKIMLSSSKKYQEAVEKGFDTVMKNHTFLNRAKSIVQCMNL
jgi:hypothetical protein